jgi:hypothetical protein
MSNVIELRPKRKATLQEKAALYYRILQTCREYILVAQEKGVYDDWKIQGTELAEFIIRLEKL